MSFIFLFPGQGSQSINMMDPFSQSAIVRDTFNEASEILGKDMWTIAQEGPEEKLALTVNTQPLMLISDIAMYRQWCELDGPSAELMAGHSLGEYSALVAADALSFTDAVPLVQTRAELMQAAVPDGVGAMAAILGLGDEEIINACQIATDLEGGTAEPANFNAPGQVVVAGNRRTVEKAIEVAKELGAKRAMLLPMSVPSHCGLIKPAAEAFAKVLETTEIHEPKAQIIHNDNVCTAATSSEIKERLKRQLFSPVRWVETIQWSIAQNIKIGIECGPGKVLAGLGKRIEKTFKVLPVNTPDAMKSSIENLVERSA